jgi:hypothetical protein
VNAAEPAAGVPEIYPPAAVRPEVDVDNVPSDEETERAFIPLVKVVPAASFSVIAKFATTAGEPTEPAEAVIGKVASVVASGVPLAAPKTDDDA